MTYENSNSDKKGRRKFIKQVGIAGITTLSLSDSLFRNQPNLKLSKPKDKQETVILFQGDSITDGNRSRNNDWNHVLGHGYAYLIASRLWYRFTNKKMMFYNRGISGNKVTDLADRWNVDCIDLKPDILSILIGVNDVASVINNNKDAVTADKYEEVYNSLIEKTKKELPGTLLVLCEPFILPVGYVKDNWEKWENETQKYEKIAAALAERHNAIFIRLQEAFNEACKQAPPDYWIWDGVHPMPAGHELIARQWIKEVRKRVSVF